jgi:hypothetical protein
MPHHKGHCRTNVIWWICSALGHSCTDSIWGQYCTSGYSCTNVIWGHCCATCPNNDIFPCCTIMYTNNGPPVPLLCNNDPWSCKLPTPLGKVWQTDMNGPIQCSLLKLEGQEYLQRRIAKNTLCLTDVEHECTFLFRVVQFNFRILVNCFLGCILIITCLSRKCTFLWGY